MAVTESAATPSSMQAAARCLYISALLAGLVTILQLSGFIPSPSVGFTLFVGVFTVGLLILVANRIAARQNWARWLNLVIFVLGSGFFLLSLLVAPQAFLRQPLLLQISGVVQTVLQTVALFAMFTRSSRNWLADAS